MAACRRAFNANEAEPVADAPGSKRFVGRRKQLSFAGSDVHDIRRRAQPARRALFPIRRDLLFSLPFLLREPPRDPRHRPPERRVPRGARHEVAFAPDSPRTLVVPPLGVVKGGFLKRVEAQRTFPAYPRGEALGKGHHRRETSSQLRSGADSRRSHTCHTGSPRLPPLSRSRSPRRRATSSTTTPHARRRGRSTLRAGSPSTKAA